MILEGRLQMLRKKQVPIQQDLKHFGQFRMRPSVFRTAFLIQNNFHHKMHHNTEIASWDQFRFRTCFV